MTVVCPSPTSTRGVGALRVDRRDAVDAAGRSPACAFSRFMFMITVLAAVICGVTVSFSAASLKVTVTVLLATRLNRNLRALRDLGLDVVLGRDARRREDRPLARAARARSAPRRD